MASVKTSTIVSASVATVVAGCLGYALYFDYRRRNDAEFRKAIKRQAKRAGKIAKEQAEEDKVRERKEIHALVDAANEEGFPEDNEEREGYFMEQVGAGEKLCQQPSTYKEAALAFYKALRVYPQPKELMQIYDKTVPKPALDLLAEMVAYDGIHRGGGFSSASSTGGNSTGGVE